MMELMILDSAFRGDRLKELRENRKLLQEPIAKHLGVTKSTFSRFETGVRQPDASMLVKIADYFNCSVDYLLGRVDDPTMTHEEYIKVAQEKYKFIGDVFTEELLQSLSQERLEKIVNYIKEQAIMAQLEQKDDSK